jgi:hypothetical protein
MLFSHFFPTMSKTSWHSLIGPRGLVGVKPLVQVDVVNKRKTKIRNTDSMVGYDDDDPLQKFLFISRRLFPALSVLSTKAYKEVEVEVFLFSYYVLKKF